MGFVDYNKLSDALKQEVRDAKPLPSMRDNKTSAAENELALRDRMFWVRKDGHMSRAKGHLKFTKKAIALLEQQMKITASGIGALDPPGKGSMREWKPGVTFGLDKIPLEGLK